MKEKYLQSQTTSAEVFIIFSPSCPAFSMQFILRELYCIITLRENADYGSAIDLLSTERHEAIMTVFYTSPILIVLLIENPSLHRSLWRRSEEALDVSSTVLMQKLH